MAQSTVTGTVKGSEDGEPLHGVSIIVQMVDVQNWIAHYTDGFEVQYIVHKSGYLKELTYGVDDKDICRFGE